MKWVIIDDEPLAREGIKTLASNIPWMEYCGEFANPLEAGDYLSKNKIDLVFMDIEMPKISGIDYLKNCPYNFKVIITSAYTEYALESFELNVVDYLLKPIRFERFLKAVTKLQNTEASVARSINQEVYIRSNRKYVRILTDNIQYIEGLKDYVIIHCSDQKIDLAINLKQALSHLPQHTFLRINKSYAINTNQIQHIDSDIVRIATVDLPIGDAYKADVIKFISSKKTLKR